MHASGDRWRLGRRPGLDGLRGVAILLVVVSHLGIKRLEPLGGTGVTVFFTLSGFLITSLLLEETAAHGRASLGAFYRRRFFRLGPAFLLMLAVVVPVEIALFGAAPYWWTTVLEAGNWISATKGAGALGLLHHTWSLAIEEQFYLAWPLLLGLLLRRFGRRGAVTVTVAGIAASLVAVHLTDGPRQSFGTDTNAGSLLAGCLLALLLSGRRVDRAPITAAPVAVLLIASGASVPLGTVFAIWLVVTRSPGVLAWSPLRGAGLVSYGWYLWNYPMTLLALALGLRLWAVPFVSLGLAVASWVLVERPFLRLKDRQISDQTSMTAAPIGPPAYRFQVPDGNARHAHL